MVNESNENKAKSDDIPRLEAEEKIKVDIDFEGINIKKRGRFPYFVFLLLIVLAIVGFFIFKKISSDKNDANDGTTPSVGESYDVGVWNGAFESKSVFKACREASVSVIAEGRACSGFVYSSDGWIATVEGVVNDNVKGQIVVVLFDGRQFLVEAFRQSRENGIILMKISASNLTTVSYNEASEIFAGEELYTFCSVGAEPSEASLFSGKVAHTKRQVELCSADGRARVLTLFQISILLTEEGVGAPLFNERGELVGIGCASGNGYASGERYMVDYAFYFNDVSDDLKIMKK